MEQYFAISTREDLRCCEYLSHKNILVSYFYWKGSLREEYIGRKHLYGDFFMDSGAFSFYNSGKEVYIDEYIKCIYDDKINKYASLDAIGNGQATQENYIIMKNAGLNPIPTFHINTDEKWLRYYIEHSDTLAIGGMVGGDRITANLDRVWKIIMQEKPTMQVHGFGVTNVEIAIRYPWYSIDGSSYNQIVKFSRAAEWQIDNFNIIDTKHFLTKMNVKVEESYGNLRHLLLFWQMEQYNRMIDYINKEHKQRNFNYLINQLTLW